MSLIVIFKFVTHNSSTLRLPLLVDNIARMSVPHLQRIKAQKVITLQRNTTVKIHKLMESRGVGSIDCYWVRKEVVTSYKKSGGIIPGKYLKN